jgi:diacylglycerol kinase
MSKNERSLTLTGRLLSVGFACRGFLTMLRTQPNAWIHAAATVVVAAVGYACHLSHLEWSLIVLAIMAVWVAEALNTSIEYLTDIASPNFHPIAARTKDVAAAGVLIAGVGAAIIGILVFAPHLVR